MSEPILTIAIPTYNRFDCLKKNVISILNNIHSDNYEIFVSDNHSPDVRIKEFLDEMANKYDNFRYVINEKNIGPDLNFLNALNLSKGKYIHLLGDDDIVAEGSDDKLISYLEQNQNLDYVSLHKVSNKEYATIQTPYEYMIKVNEWITCMSNMIFRKDNLIKLMNPEQFDGSMLLQSYLVIDSIAVSETRTIAAINNYYFLPCDINNFATFTYDYCDVFINSLSSVVFFAKDKLGFSKKQCKKMFANDIIFVSKAIVLAKINNNKKHIGHVYKYFFRVTCKYLYGWIYYLPACLTPTLILKGLMKFYRRFLKKK